MRQGFGSAQMVSGWGHATCSVATVVAAATTEEVAERVAAAGARGIVARGLGRAYGDAAQNSGGLILDLSRLDQIGPIDSHGQIRVEAGVSLDSLIRRVLPQGWFVPVSPGTAWVTVGGAVAADVHGKNQHRDGGFCDHLDRIELAAPCGPIVARAGEDAFLATAGGMGLTGVVTAATMRLRPVESAWMTVRTHLTEDLDETMAALANGDHNHAYSVAWLDLTQLGRRIGRGVVDFGDHATERELPDRLRSAPLDLPPRRSLPSPPGLTGLVNLRAIRLFNAIWYRKASAGSRIESISSYFHPLDAIADWYRLYGSRGLVQYLFALPSGNGTLLTRLVERLARARAPVALAVLKRFGRAAVGPLGFPQQGWTLAVDLPTAWGGLTDLLDGLDIAV